MHKELINTSLYPTTYLDAVNTMLASIGEAPVNAIGVGLSESRIAQLTLDRASRSVQKRGWWFNTEDMTIYPNSAGELQLPANTLSLDSDKQRYVLRNQRIYDKLNNTYKFNTPLTVTVVLALEWEALPETARSYIVALACKRFQETTVGSPQLSASLEREAALAFVELQEEELEAGNYNLFANPHVNVGATAYRRR